MIQEAQPKAEPRKTNWTPLLLYVALVLVTAVFVEPYYTTDEPAPKSVRLSNLKQSALAAILFANDHGDTLPDMRNTNVLRMMLLPYLKDGKLLRDPITKQPLLPNFALSHVPVGAIDNPHKAVFMYEPDMESNGTRQVAFVDGYAKSIPEDEFIKDMALTGKHSPALGPLLGQWECVDGTVTLKGPNVAILQDRNGKSFMGVATFDADDRLSITFGGKRPDLAGTVEWESLDEFKLVDRPDNGSFRRVK